MRRCCCQCDGYDPGMADQPTPQAALETAVAALSAADAERDQVAQLAAAEHPSAQIQEAAE